MPQEWMLYEWMPCVICVKISWSKAVRERVGILSEWTQCVPTLRVNNVWVYAMWVNAPVCEFFRGDCCGSQCCELNYLYQFRGFYSKNASSLGTEGHLGERNNLKTWKHASSRLSIKSAAMLFKFSAHCVVLQSPETDKIGRQNSTYGKQMLGQFNYNLWEIILWSSKVFWAHSRRRQYLYIDHCRSILQFHFSRGLLLKVTNPVSICMLESCSNPHTLTVWYSAPQHGELVMLGNFTGSHTALKA